MKKWLVFLGLATSVQAAEHYYCVYDLISVMTINSNGTPREYFKLTVVEGKITHIFERWQSTGWPTWEGNLANPPIIQEGKYFKTYDILKLNDRAFDMRQIRVTNGNFSKLDIKTLRTDDEGIWRASMKLNCNLYYP